MNRDERALLQDTLRRLRATRDAARAAGTNIRGEVGRACFEASFGLTDAIAAVEEAMEDAGLQALFEAEQQPVLPLPAPIRCVA